MKLRYQFRVYPSARQSVELAKALGCARVVWNDALRIRQDAYKQGKPVPSIVELAKLVITAARKTPEREWLGEVSAVVPQSSLRDLGTAYSNFFASKKGTRKGPAMGLPRFKGKTSRQAVRFTRAARFSLTPDRRLRLPKIGDVEVRWSRELPCEPSGVTVVKDAAGRHFASFVAEGKLLPAVDGNEINTGILPRRGTPPHQDLVPLQASEQWRGGNVLTRLCFRPTLESDDTEIVGARPIQFQRIASGAMWNRPGEHRARGHLQLGFTQRNLFPSLRLAIPDFQADYRVVRSHGTHDHGTALAHCELMATEVRQYPRVVFKGNLTVAKSELATFNGHLLLSSPQEAPHHPLLDR